MKKVLKINCIHNDKLSCLERPIATTINWYHKEYRYIFASSWSFSYNFMEEYKGIRSVPELKEFLENAKKYTGISFYVQTASIFRRYETIIEELTKNHPVITYIDSFWCPWFPSYGKSHIHHYILIIGVNTEREFFICLDKLDTQKKVILPFQDYNQGSGEIITISFHDEVIMKNIVENSILKLNPTLLKRNIDLFADKVKDSLDIDLHLNNYHDARVSPLYTWLKGVANDRLNYCEFLQLSSTNSYLYFIEKLQEISEEWRSVMILLIRAGKRKNSPDVYTRLSNRIHKIAEQEFILMNKLKRTIYDE